MAPHPVWCDEKDLEGSALDRRLPSISISKLKGWFGGLARPTGHYVELTLELQHRVEFPATNVFSDTAVPRNRWQRQERAPFIGGYHTATGVIVPTHDCFYSSDLEAMKSPSSPALHG